ncbi:MAG: hypothetical protein FWE37_04730 [Spirochaetaceae bacterium]|nr:hypothetical protein [Spirochaetaceae bacterium]
MKKLFIFILFLLAATSHAQNFGGIVTSVGARAGAGLGLFSGESFDDNLIDNDIIGIGPAFGGDIFFNFRFNNSVAFTPQLSVAHLRYSYSASTTTDSIVDVSRHATILGLDFLLKYFGDYTGGILYSGAGIGLGYIIHEHGGWALNLIAEFGADVPLIDGMFTIGLRSSWSLHLSGHNDTFALSIFSDAISLRIGYAINL